MFNSWMSFAFQAAQLGIEAQNVVGLRLVRLAGGGTTGLAEARLMVTDKMAALTEIQLAVAATVLTGHGHNSSRKMLQVFRRRVRANRKRLSRR